VPAAELLVLAELPREDPLHVAAGGQVLVDQHLQDAGQAIAAGDKRGQGLAFGKSIGAGRVLHAAGVYQPSPCRRRG
jgi:hypothetical protein